MKRKLDREGVLRILSAELPYLRQRYGVVRLALYGSFARNAARTGSDVDLLVELARPMGLEFVALADYLEARLGRDVDLATFAALAHSSKNPRRTHIARSIEESLTDVLPAP
jgi:predicted nucleotidyltransferase